MRPTLVLIAEVLAGLGWTLTYIAIIYRSWKDRTYGMPIVALSANIAWEGLFTFFIPGPRILWYRDIAWFSLDVIMALQCIRYAQRELRYPGVNAWAPLIVIGTMGMGAALVSGFIWELHDLRGWYSGFVMNLMMSVLFVFMLINRNDVRGQSLYIALFKWLGTLGALMVVIVASPANVLTPFTEILTEQWYAPSPLILMLYAIIFIFDVIYIVAMYRSLVARNINPWVRL